MLKRGWVILVLTLLFAFSVSAQIADEIADEDGDGFCSFMEEGCPEELDCNDNNPLINPDATEIVNEVDDDCNGIVDDIKIICQDSDSDGYNVPVGEGTEEECGELDCNDASAYINPGVAENCEDGKDNDCDGLVDMEDPDCYEEGGCTLVAGSSGWFGCESMVPTDQITSAHEGDTIFLLLWATDCNNDAEVAFDVYEYTEGDEAYLVEEGLTPTITFFDIEDEGITGVDIWAVPWAAEYFPDDDDSDPEFYFVAMVDDNGNYLEMESGTSSSSLLVVSQCPEDNPDCADECVNFGEGNSFGSAGEPYVETCNPTSIDCTNAKWSDCDPATNKMTRDVTKCQIFGVDEECEAQVRELIPSERSCIPDKRPSTPQKQTGLEEEDEEDKDGGWGWWLFIIIILIALLVAGGAYFVKKRMAKEGKPPKEAKNPFNTENDLKAVKDYIKSARSKGLKDDEISKMLVKGGWKPEQVKYALSKMGEIKKSKSPFKVAKDEKAVVGYIGNALKKGYKEEQIKNALLKSGRSKEQIKFAFEQAKK